LFLAPWNALPTTIGTHADEMPSLPLLPPQLGLFVLHLQFHLATASREKGLRDIYVPPYGDSPIGFAPKRLSAHFQPFVQYGTRARLLDSQRNRAVSRNAPANPLSPPRHSPTYNPTAVDCPRCLHRPLQRSTFPL